MNGSVLLLAGGGGHTGYAVALAEELKSQVELRFLAPEDDLLSIARLQIYGKVETLVKPRHPRTPIYRFLPRLAKSFIQSMKRIPKNCRCVVSTGSNFCIPPALISWLRGIPVINIESADRFVKPSRQPVYSRNSQKLRLFNGKSKRGSSKDLFSVPLSQEGWLSLGTVDISS